MAYTLTLDADKCQGYANCFLAAPELWDFDEETDIAVLRLAAPPAELREKADASARGCPAAAITVVDLDDA